MNLVEFHDAIRAHAENWTPTYIVGENLPNKTADQGEFIRLTVVDGIGLIDETAGNITDVRGLTTDNIFFLQFDVYTPKNSDKRRNYELCQEVQNHWQVKNLGGGLDLDAASLTRVGEEPPHYRMIVTIPGRREDFINL